MKRTSQRLGNLIVCFLLLLPAFTLAQTGESAGKYAESLKVLKKKITQTEREMQFARKEAKEAKARLAGVEEELEKLKKEESESVALLKSLSVQVDSLELQIQDITDQISLRKDSFSRRISQMYKSRRKLSSISFLLVSTELSSFYRRADYLKRLVENDNEQLQEYRILLDTLSRTSSDLEDLKVREEKTQSRIAGIRKDILPRKLEAARLLKELSDTIRKKEQLLKSYHEEERELEEIIQKITGGVKKTEDRFPHLPVDSAFVSAALPFPVEKGTVVQHFGKQKHDEFSDVIFVKGIEVATIEGSSVHAVSRGTVVFNSELPGFGNVLIVEHPGEYYTLYGRINPEKFIDETVEAGDILGRATTPDQKGRNFYFEIRKEGKPLNPEKYLVKYQ
jgi:murein hydrolase activator